jgi:hypothetical protein
VKNRLQEARSKRIRAEKDLAASQARLEVTRRYEEEDFCCGSFSPWANEESQVQRNTEWLKNTEKEEEILDGLYEYALDVFLPDVKDKEKME